MLNENIKSFRLGIQASDYAEAYSFLRVAGPFQTMAHEERRLELIRPPQKNGDQSLTWDWILQCDAIFIHHPLCDEHLHLMATARRLGRPVWIELVDDIFNIPRHSPIAKTYANKKAVRDNITSAIDLANVVTTTSQLCKDALVNGCDLDSTTRKSMIAQPNPPSAKIVVLPEAAFFEPSQLPRRKCITWRGLNTHDEDTAGVLEQVCRVAKDFPDWEWALFGQPSPEFVEQLSAAAGEERVRVSPLWPTPWDMFEAWKGCAPYLHLVPLENNVFNLSKSHLAYLEATAAGAAVIVPDYLPEWQQPGVIAYAGGVIQHNGKQNLEAVLRRELVNYPHNGKLHPNVETAREFVYPGRTLAAMNALRWMVINKLAMKSGVLKPKGAIGVSHADDPSNAPEPKAEKQNGGTSNIQHPTFNIEFQSHSQSGQDRFAWELFKDEGGLMHTFLDIGCLCEGRPDARKISNTYGLEQLSWFGLLVDRVQVTLPDRKSPYVCGDARTLDWQQLMKETKISSFDYLSLDVDEATVATLKNLLASGVRWRAATIEHDSYEFGPAARDEMRKLLTEAGYTLLVPDVQVRCNDGVLRPFEDWWVDARKVNMEVAEKFRGTSNNQQPTSNIQVPSEVGK